MCLGALGCDHSTARTAAFRARPDSTKAGDLQGPFSGQVSDAATHDPVSGAFVYASWTYESGQGAIQPMGFRFAVASTDANGRYQIERVQSPPAGRLTDFQLVIYKRGYVAYRSDRRFQDLGPRFDFAQKNNEVQLDRWNSGLSHVRHLRYIGGGGPLASLTAWEQDEAAVELSGGGSSKMSSDLLSTLSDGRLIAAQLLGEAEIKDITGFDGSFESGPLNDEADTDSYSSQHFKALGQPEVYDVALRLWRLDGDASQERFSELESTLPGVSLRNDIADRSLLAVEGDIQGFAFMDARRGLVVLITCGKGQCSKIEHLVEIARKVYENIQAVMPQGSAP